jgi:hypothetical protein
VPPATREGDVRLRVRDPSEAGRVSCRVAVRSDASTDENDQEHKTDDKINNTTSTTQHQQQDQEQHNEHNKINKTNNRTNIKNKRSRAGQRHTLASYLDIKIKMHMSHRSLCRVGVLGVASVLVSGGVGSPRGRRYSRGPE